jgi:hypothetical protein
MKINEFETMLWSSAEYDIIYNSEANDYTIWDDEGHDIKSFNSLEEALNYINEK